MSDDYQYVTKNYVDNAINSGGTVPYFQPELSYELNPQTNTVNDTSHIIMKWKNSGYNLTLTNIKLFKSYDNVSFTEVLDLTDNLEDEKYVFDVGSPSTGFTTIDIITADLSPLSKTYTFNEATVKKIYYRGIATSDNSSVIYSPIQGVSIVNENVISGDLEVINNLDVGGNTTINGILNLNDDLLVDESIRYKNNFNITTYDQGGGIHRNIIQTKGDDEDTLELRGGDDEDTLELRGGNWGIGAGLVKLGDNVEIDDDLNVGGNVDITGTTTSGTIKTSSLKSLTPESSLLISTNYCNFACSGYLDLNYTSKGNANVGGDLYVGKNGGGDLT
eukprot:Awhi_evm1s1925